MTCDLFPFKVKSYHNGHFCELPWQSHATFCKYKPKDLSWYAYDVEVLSKDKAKFTVYDMHDFCSGGIGDIVDEFESRVDEQDLKGLINDEISRIAVRQEELEFQAARKARVEQIKKSIRRTLYNTPPATQ